MPDELLERIRRFHDHTFAGVQAQFQPLIAEGQHPRIFLIGCSDSRLFPCMLRSGQPAGQKPDGLPHGAQSG